MVWKQLRMATARLTMRRANRVGNDDDPKLIEAIQ